MTDEDRAVQAVKEVRAKAYRQGWRDAMTAIRRKALDIAYDCPMHTTPHEADKAGLPDRIADITEWTRDDQGNLTRTIGKA